LSWWSTHSSCSPAGSSRRLASTLSNRGSSNVPCERVLARVRVRVRVRVREWDRDR
jgi:hypothetical protein